MKKFEFIYFGQLLIASSDYIFLCLTFCLVKLLPTLKYTQYNNFIKYTNKTSVTYIIINKIKQLYQNKYFRNLYCLCYLF